ncbi:putative hydrogenase nickel incorporation protein HypA [Salmonella enterica subsp. enterica serovar Choleraesuis]|nr:putative hydrogenase nickel incorporation protein HypA [Salmonella enterica subsp. enterica serovar Choleraesuis]
MHELSLAQSVVELLENQAREHRFQRVNQVWLSVGALACVETEALMTGLRAASRNTLAQSAQFHIELVPAAGWCFNCSAAFTTLEVRRSCPDCGSLQVQIDGGQEMRVREVDVS